MKPILLILLSFFPFWAEAQCPYISGILADASNAGTPTGEGKNEFVVFNTGTSSINVNTVFISYGINTTSTAFSIDGAAVPNVWVAPTTAGLLTNSAGTLTQVTSGTIPANRNVVVISKDNAVSYDFQTFGTDVYVLSYDQTLAGVTGFLTAGRFPNTGTADRYLRISQGATCRDTVSYIADNLPGTDGGGVKWNAAGVATYANTGSSGAILPINLLSYNTSKSNNTAVVDWTTSGNSTAQYFEIEKSLDARVFNTTGIVMAESGISDAVKKYSFNEHLGSAATVYYRLKMVDASGESSFSSTSKIVTSNNSDQLVIYPNPTTNHLFIINHKEFEEARIIDYLGKTQLKQALHIGSNSMDLSALRQGVYYLQLVSKMGVENHKIAKE